MVAVAVEIDIQLRAQPLRVPVELQQVVVAQVFQTALELRAQQTPVVVAEAVEQMEVPLQIT